MHLDAKNKTIRAMFKYQPPRSGRKYAMKQCHCKSGRLWSCAFDDDVVAINARIKANVSKRYINSCGVPLQYGGWNVEQGTTSDLSTNGYDYPAAGEEFSIPDAADPPLRESRPRSLWFRLHFVFPVCHPFPLVVSQYLNHASLILGPSQIRTCAVSASGSQISLAFRTLACAVQRDQVCQTLRIYQRMKVCEAIECFPVHIAILTPTAQVTFRQPKNFRTKRHQ